MDYAAAGQTYTVKTSDGRSLTRCPRSIAVHGDNSVIPRGTTVIIHHELGFPCINSILSGANMAPNSPETTPIRVTEVTGIGGEDPVYVNDRPGNGRSPNAPMDVMGDDKVFSTRDGNLLGILAGGTNVLKSAGMAQIRTHAIDELVEILSNRFKHLTAMGNLDITNDAGKTSLIWRAGSDQGSENGANRGHWTVRLDVGATGDLFNLEVTTPGGQSLARFHMSAEGRIEIVGLGGVDIFGGNRGTTDEVIDSDKSVLVTGAMTTEVQGAVTETAGSLDVSVSGGDTKVVGGSAARTVTEDDLLLVMGGQKHRIYKDAIRDYLGGNVGITLGNPALGGLIAPPNNYQVVNFGGDISHAVLGPLGRFVVMSNTPGSVMLGASGAAVFNPVTGLFTLTPVAPYGAVLAEPLLNLLATMCLWNDTHLHLSAMGPTGPAAAAPTGPLTPLIMPGASAIRSLRVLIGA